MGLRVATEIIASHSGQLQDSEDRRGANAIRCQSARWCDYGGILNAHRIGMALMCPPGSYRPSWMQAMRKSQPSKVAVHPGKPLRLRFAIWIYSVRSNGDPIIDSVVFEISETDRPVPTRESRETYPGYIQSVTKRFTGTPLPA